MKKPEDQESVLCPNCGKAHEEDEPYCPICGHSKKTFEFSSDKPKSIFWGLRTGPYSRKALFICLLFIPLGSCSGCLVSTNIGGNIGGGFAYFAAIVGTISVLIGFLMLVANELLDLFKRK